MIVVKNLCKSFGAHKAIDNINFCLSKGQIVALLGPNGAGKTTLMRLMSGYLDADSGQVSIFDKNINDERIACLQNIGYVPENGFLYSEMTVLEFLQYAAEIRDIRGETFIKNLKEVAEALELGAVLTQKNETLSKGYKRRVGIAAALIHKPKVLILDEPTEGLDPNQKVSIRNFLHNYAKENIILISTHIMEEVEALADRVILLNQGKLVKDTTPKELRELFPENSITTSFYKITKDIEAN